MKIFIQIVSAFFFVLTLTVNASECYHYHTPQFYKLFIDSNQLIFQHTVKDPNRISFVSQERVVIPNINLENFKIVAEDGSTILFSTLKGYFLLEKSIQEVRDYGVSKIGTTREVEEVIGTQFICIDGLWSYITAKRNSTNLLKNKLKDAPCNLEYIGSSNRGHLLFKNNERVYLFSERDLTFNIIENLNPKSVKYVINDDTYMKILYDDDTIYTLDAHFSFTDHTPLLSQFSSFKSFKNASITQFDGNFTIDTKDGYIWVYVSGGKTFDDIGHVNFVPLKATYLNDYKDLINVDGKIYRDVVEAVLNWGATDVSLIQNRDAFRFDGVFYTDDANYYDYDYDTKIFNPLKTPAIDAVYFPAITTYGYLGNRDMFIANRTMYFLNNKQKYVANKTSTSPIKNLQLAYAYDDKLLIENKEIKNISDRESLQFYGSIVNVISGCDGGRGQYPVVIDVYYYFKDKEHLYVCNTKNLKMRIVKDSNLDDTNTTDFKKLEVLMNSEINN